MNKLGLLAAAAMFAAPVGAAPLPTSQSSETLINFSPSGTLSVAGARFRFSQDTPAGSVFFDIYGDANGQDLIATVQLSHWNYFSMGSERAVDLLRLDGNQNPDPAYDALSDGVFSIGLWQEDGSADLVGANSLDYSCGPLGCVYTLGSEGTPVVQDAPAALPEPATWALMAGGFGLAAAGLRRRKLAAA